MSAKTIKIDSGIEILLTDDGGGKIIKSNLKCSPVDSTFDEQELSERYNDMMSALESLILAHACAGIDVSSPAYMEGIETACESCIKATE